MRTATLTETATTTATATAAATFWGVTFVVVVVVVYVVVFVSGAVLYLTALASRCTHNAHEINFQYFLLFNSSRKHFPYRFSFTWHTNFQSIVVFIYDL